MAGGTIYKMKVFVLPVLTGKVTSRFGYRRDPLILSVRNYHSGLDLSAQEHQLSHQQKVLWNLKR